MSGSRASTSHSPEVPEEGVPVAVRAQDLITELGVASILRADRRLRVLAETGLPRAEVVVVVEQTAGERVFAAMRELRAASRRESPPRCVLVTDHFHRDALMTAVESGMAALVPWSGINGKELVRTVLAVRAHSAVLPPRVLGDLLTRVDGLRRQVLEPNGLTLSGLSTRECDVLRLLARGCATGEVATALCCSESTVKNVLTGLLNRFGLANRAHAVAFAVRAGII